MVTHSTSLAQRPRLTPSWKIPYMATPGVLPVAANKTSALDHQGRGALGESSLGEARPMGFGAALVDGVARFLRGQVKEQLPQGYIALASWPVGTCAYRHRPPLLQFACLPRSPVACTLQLHSLHWLLDSLVSSCRPFMYRQ